LRGTETAGENRPSIVVRRRKKLHRRIHRLRREFPDSEYSALMSRGDFRSQMLQLNHEICSLRDSWIEHKCSIKKKDEVEEWILLKIPTQDL
jgi:hypothetical protein